MLIKKITGRMYEECPIHHWSILKKVRKTMAVLL